VKAPIFERAEGIALTGKQSESNPSCWFWTKQIAKNSVDFIFVIGFCKSDKSLVMIMVDGPKAVALSFNGKEWNIFLSMSGSIIDVLPISEEKAVEFAELYFRELDSL
jgi:hypothetical protein